MRVVSLLPSATECLWLVLETTAARRASCGVASGRAVGGVELVGRSHECDFPPVIADRPILTAQRTDFAAQGAAGVDAAVRAASVAGQSLYTLDEALLESLRPDVILTQDLCEVCSIDLGAVRRVAERLSRQPRIVSLNPASIEDVFDDVLRVGEAVGLEGEAQRAVVMLRERFYRAADFVTPYEEGPRVAFLEWTDPLFVGGHWTPQLIERAGGSHPLNPAASGGGHHTPATTTGAGKSIRVPVEAVAAMEPEAIVVCPCGVGLGGVRAEAARLADQAWFRATPAWRAGRVALVDGNQMFNRPGPRLVDAFEWLVGWLNHRPEVIPSGFPWEPMR